MRDALRFSRSLAAAVLASVVAGCGALSVVLAPTPVVVATGTPGGGYHPVGNAICRMVNLRALPQTSPCVAVASDGAVSNLQQIRTGKVSFGLAQSDVAYAAAHGLGPFALDGANSRLRLVAALHVEAFTVVARVDAAIHDFHDLRGKRIGIGTTGAGYTYTRDVVLGFYNWTISDADRLLELGPAEQNQALCDNKVDAIIFRTGHPDGLTREATTGCQARLVRVAGPPIDRLRAARPYYIASVIPGGMYSGNPDTVATIATQAVLVTSIDQPQELVFAMVKALVDNLADFRKLHPVLSALKRHDLLPPEAIMPLHPGAMKFFRDAALAR